MKKIISFLVLMFFIMSIAVIAAPQPPYILFGHVEWNNQMLSGSKLDITVNSVVNTITTDGDGYWVYQITEYSNGNVITLKVLDGCGTGDICTKSVTVGAEGTKDYAQVDFSITGELSCPPTQCPTCSGGGGGGCYYREEICNDKFPCDEYDDSCPVPEYTQANCDVLYPCEEVLPLVCDVCKESESCPEESCPVIPEGLTGGQIVVYIISLIGIGGLGAFVGTKLTSDRISRVKGVTYRVAVERDGDIREEHRHAGLKSYHSINTSHREAHEKHPKGERYPLYEKDEDGVYRYIEA